MVMSSKASLGVLFAVWLGGLLVLSGAGNSGGLAEEECTGIATWVIPGV